MSGRLRSSTRRIVLGCRCSSRTTYAGLCSGESGRSPEDDPETNQLPKTAQNDRSGRLGGFLEKRGV